MKFSSGLILSPSSKYRVPAAVPSKPSATNTLQGVVLASLVVIAYFFHVSLILGALTSSRT